jgi:hypothetical protein
LQDAKVQLSLLPVFGDKRHSLCQTKALADFRGYDKVTPVIYLYLDCFAHLSS